MTPADTWMTRAAAPPPPPPPRPPRLTYHVTGAAAQARLVPLLQEMVEVDWYVFVLKPLPTAPHPAPCSVCHTPPVCPADLQSKHARYSDH